MGLSRIGKSDCLDSHKGDIPFVLALSRRRPAVNPRTPFRVLPFEDRTLDRSVTEEMGLTVITRRISTGERFYALFPCRSVRKSIGRL